MSKSAVLRFLNFGLWAQPLCGRAFILNASVLLLLWGSWIEKPASNSSDAVSMCSLLSDIAFEKSLFPIKILSFNIEHRCLRTSMFSKIGKIDISIHRRCSSQLYFKSINPSKWTKTQKLLKKVSA